MGRAEIGSSRDVQRILLRVIGGWKEVIFLVIQNSKRIMTFLFLDYYLHFEIAKIILPFNLKWSSISNNHRHVQVFSGCILELGITLSNWCLGYFLTYRGQCNDKNKLFTFVLFKNIHQFYVRVDHLLKFSTLKYVHLRNYLFSTKLALKTNDETHLLANVSD